MSDGGGGGGGDVELLCKVWRSVHCRRWWWWWVVYGGTGHREIDNGTLLLQQLLLFCCSSDLDWQLCSEVMIMGVLVPLMVHRGAVNSVSR